MSTPITLWNPNPVRTSDDSGVLIVKTILPKAVDRAGAYDSTPSRPLPYVPPLEHFCLKVLSQFPEQVHVAGPHKLRYSRTRSKVDVFRSLFPAWETCNFSLREIDPRLWATIVQLYSNIPEVLSSYPIALEDPHLPVLQSIPSTQHFALITTLDLRNCQDLTDESVLALKALDHLYALNATNTQIGSHGIKLLSRALRFNDHGERRGPWGLRILRLRKCRNIDKELFKYLNNFPLLCAVDVRETTCNSMHKLQNFEPSPHEELFEPHTISDSIEFLQGIQEDLFSHRRPFTLSVQDQRLKESNVKRELSKTASTKHGRSTQGTFVVLPSSSGSTGMLSYNRRKSRSGIQVGHSGALEIEQKKEIEAEQTARRDYAFCKRNGYDFEAYHKHGIRTRHHQHEMPYEPWDGDVLFQPWGDEGPEPRTRENGSRMPGRQCYDQDTSSITFYKKPLTRPHVPARRVEARHADSGSMLFRYPPPWSALESINPEVVRPTPTDERKVTALKGGGKGNFALSSMAKAFHLRKLASRSDARTQDIKGCRSDRQQLQIKPRRPIPFMKRPIFKGTEDDDSDIDSDEESPKTRSLNAMDNENRVMRPISNFKPPPLPTQFQQKARGPKLKQTTLNCHPSPANRSFERKASAEKRNIKHRISFDETLLHRTMKPGPQSGSLPQEFMQVGGERPPKKAKTGFDWEMWSKKPES